MKKILTFIFVGLAFTLVGCNETEETTEETSADSPVVAEVEEYNNIFKYTHIDGKGEEVEENGYVIYENENLNFVQYQVAYTSCTCRSANKNYRSLMYVEINNDGTFKDIKFDYYGDSDPIPYSDVNSVDYWSDTYFPQFLNKGQDNIDTVDSVSTATVTSENIKRILDGLSDYHNEKYSS